MMMALKENETPWLGGLDQLRCFSIKKWLAARAKAGATHLQAGLRPLGHVLSFSQWHPHPGHFHFLHLNKTCSVLTLICPSDLSWVTQEPGGHLTWEGSRSRARPWRGSDLVTRWDSGMWNQSWLLYHWSGVWWAMCQALYLNLHNNPTIRRLESWLKRFQN